MFDDPNGWGLSDQTTTADPQYWQTNPTQNSPSDFGAGADSSGANSWADVLRYGLKRAIDAQVPIQAPQNTKPEIKPVTAAKTTGSTVFGSLTTADGKVSPLVWLAVAGVVVYLIARH